MLRRKFYKKKNQQVQPQVQEQGGVKSEESVPFLYRQKSNAMMIGKPQPLKIFEQNEPSFEPRISNAIKIQRVMLLELP